MIQQPSAGEDHAASIRLKLGFDPREAVAAGIRRGWVEHRKPEPHHPLGFLHHGRQDSLTGRKEAAEFLGVSVWTVDNLVSHRVINPKRINGRVALFPLEELVKVKAARAAVSEMLP